MMNELLPFTSQLNANPFMITMGHSFGAYHDANVAFRYPYLVDRVIGMSGVYDIKKFTGGSSDPKLYFVKPTELFQKASPPPGLPALPPLYTLSSLFAQHAHSTKKQRLSQHFCRPNLLQFL